MDKKNPYVSNIVQSLQVLHIAWIQLDTCLKKYEFQMKSFSNQQGKKAFKRHPGYICRGQNSQRKIKDIVLQY